MLLTFTDQGHNYQLTMINILDIASPCWPACAFTSSSLSASVSASVSPWDIYCGKHSN